MKSIIAWLSLMAMTLAHSQPYPAPHKAGHYNISAAKAKQLVSDFKKAKKSMVILDIRTPEEHAGSHIQDSLLIDYLGDDFKASLSKLDKEKVYLIHCRSGGRSSSAFDLMKKLGFKSVYHLDGGIIAWKKAGGTTK
tara:strand:+ start:473 stop:883 length:411 start_codon:yes stop_codon:yes gene_type:complete